MPAQTLRLTRRGWSLLWAALAIVVVTTAMNRREGLFIAAFLVLAVVLCSATVAFQKTPLRMTRTVPAEAQCGEPMEIVCTMKSIGITSTVAGWTDAVPQSFGRSPVGVLPPAHLLRGGRAAVRYRVVPTVRGLHEIGPFSVTLTDPLGVCEVVRAVGSPSTALVLPRVSPLAPSELFTAASEGRRRDRTRPTAPRADELIARDYRPGDPLRRVHWRATARHGQLMVRQEEPQADPDVLVLLDVPPGQTRIDACVDLAASISLHLGSLGYRITVALPETEWLTVSPKDAREILMPLAVWPGGTIRSAHETAQRCEQRFADRIPLILITTDADRLVALADLATQASPAIAFIATGSGLLRDTVPATWQASGLSDRIDVPASWDRLNRRLLVHD
ncbi:DUF58 domain-containing protein [Microbacterium sp. MPKO10]|uniref:DUF58 domain-containing protein n=1 Tax=Microbacterium sp. MPKO10 TaxID=2989818 RepID=UPI0022359A39|nr:DUF58 domain-containing protein [Microbacterium sp. MPKO10]MCW4459317.1 DUF58 domain-containing protein [Microbacterium sp. MPKO10]